MIQIFRFKLFSRKINVDNTVLIKAKLVPLLSLIPDPTQVL